METLQSMNLFIWSVQEGSFSAAGRRFNLSPASVSRQISSLERDLGVRLLNRTSRKIALTEAGEYYFRSTKSTLERIGDTKRRLSNLQTQPMGTLRVSSGIGLGQDQIGPAITQFMKKYPEIRIEAIFSHDPVDLVRENIDVDICLGQLKDSNLMIRKLTQSERIICASRDYLKQYGRPSRPEQLAEHNCISYAPHSGPVSWRFRREDKVTIVPVNGSLVANSGAMLRSAVMEGLGISLLHSFCLGDEDLRKLERLFPDYEAGISSFDSGIYAVYHPTRYPNAKTTAFIDFLWGYLKPLRMRDRVVDEMSAVAAE